MLFFKERVLKSLNACIKTFQNETELSPSNFCFCEAISSILLMFSLRFPKREVFGEVEMVVVEVVVKLQLRLNYGSS